MLPDFPKIKAKLHGRLMAHFNQELRRRTIDVPRFLQHEGDRCTVQREDGTIVELQSEEIEARHEIPRGQSIGLADAKQIYTDMADQMADHHMRSFLRVVNESVAEAGTAVDARASKFNFDLFLETLSKMQLDFNEKGEPILPTVVLHPKTWEAIKQEVAKWEQNPKYKTRHRQLIERKRGEWRERESRRKLVD
jgi:hypothetical protein